LARLWRVVLQQFAQPGGSSMVHERTNCDLHRFQIQVAGFAPTGKDDAQQMVDLEGHFAVDRIRRFFSWGVSGWVESSSPGRKRQIFSLSCTKLWLSF
jgi:hypothetical protein